jgi:hypothetical protein
MTCRGSVGPEYSAARMAEIDRECNDMPEPVKRRGVE